MFLSWSLTVAINLRLRSSILSRSGSNWGRIFFFEFGDELNSLLPQLRAERMREVAPIANEVAE